MEKVRVFRTKASTSTIRIFQYGNGYRVQYTKYSNSKVDSKLLAHHDEEYQDEMRAKVAFQEMVSVFEPPTPPIIARAHEIIRNHQGDLPMTMAEGIVLAVEEDEIEQGVTAGYMEVVNRIKAAKV